jgi:hypothetical protein
MRVQPLKAYIRALVSRVRPAADPGQPSTLDQMKEVIDLAGEFDRLQAIPVWEKIVAHLGTSVVITLDEAVKFKFEPERMTPYVIRWDAKRELVDNLLGWIEATQKERDRIIAEFKETKGVS